MLETRPLFVLRAEMAEPQMTPGGPCGDRRYIPVTGGDFKGERLSGRLLNGGADSQLIRPDGVATLDVRVALQTNDGEIVFMKGLGLRHGPPEVLARMAAGAPVDRSEYYFREAFYFEAAGGPYAWLNKIMGIGIGERTPDTVRLDVFEVL